MKSQIIHSKILIAWIDKIHLKQFITQIRVSIYHSKTTIPNQIILNTKITLLLWQNLLCSLSLLQISIMQPQMSKIKQLLWWTSRKQLIMYQITLRNELVCLKMKDPRLETPINWIVVVMCSTSHKLITDLSLARSKWWWTLRIIVKIGWLLIMIPRSSSSRIILSIRKPSKPLMEATSYHLENLRNSMS